MISAKAWAGGHQPDDGALQAVPALDLLRRLPAAAWAASSRPVQMQDFIAALLSVMQSPIDKSAGGADQAGGPLPWVHAMSFGGCINHSHSARS